MKGIYCIECLSNGRRYVGKSVNLDSRRAAHFSSLRNKRHYNKKLQASFDKYGEKDFRWFLLEEISGSAECLADAEMYWMERLRTFGTYEGFNLLFDSPAGYEFSEEMRKSLSEAQTGELNGNFGHHWSDDQKERMSNIAKERHSSGQFYNDEWRKKLGDSSREMWRDLDKRKAMAKNVSKARSSHDFYQYTKKGDLVGVWKDIHHVLRANPSWKWQNIYAACNGSKKSYQGFVWQRKEKTDDIVWYVSEGSVDTEEYEDVDFAALWEEMKITP